MRAVGVCTAAVAAMLVPTAAAFHVGQPFLPQRTRHSSLQAFSSATLLLSDVSTTTMDTFNALNGAMMTGATDGTVIASPTASGVVESLDPSVALAGAVAAAALIGLLTLNMKDSSTTTTTSISRLYPKPPPANASAPTTAGGGDTANKNKDDGKDDNKVEPPGEQQPDAFQDVVEAREALAAFEQGSRSGLLSSLGRLTALIRSTRRTLDSETELRQQAETNLKLIGEELRDVEDKYELGQNELSKTTRALQTTKADLIQTQKQLEKTTASLEELQQERQSLRKLGLVAWRLSKDRVQTRIRKIRGRKGKVADAAVVADNDDDGFEIAEEDQLMY